MAPTAWDFQNRLTAILNGARQDGKSYVDIESGNLHRAAGGYPESGRDIPVCCDVMRRMMRAGDSILQESTNGDGSTLVIRYLLSKLF